MSRDQSCPFCGSSRVAPIVYGLPGRDLAAAEERGEVVLGGCVVSDDAPTHGCIECGRRWSIDKNHLPARTPRREIIVRLDVYGPDGKTITGSAIAYLDGTVELCGHLTYWENRPAVGPGYRPVYKDEGELFVRSLATMMSSYRRSRLTEYKTEKRKRTSKLLTEEEKRRRAERFMWREGDIRWLVPPGKSQPLK